MGELEKIVERWAYNKTEMDSYKKAVDDDNKLIKQLMREGDLKECQVGDFIAKYSVSVSEDFDEVKLLARLRELNCDSLIVMKPTVDLEGLENAIYNGVLKASELAGCTVTKKTERLTLAKSKK